MTVTKMVVYGTWYIEFNNNYKGIKKASHLNHLNELKNLGIIAH